MWVLAMELLKHLRSVNKVGKFLSPFTDFVTLPMDKIL